MLFIQGHRFWYHSKVNILLPVSDYTNLPPILHRFQIFTTERGVPHFNALARDDPCQYRHK